MNVCLRNGRVSSDSVESYCLARNITADQVERYKSHRLALKAKPATINRELRLLVGGSTGHQGGERAFGLLGEAPRRGRVPSRGARLCLDDRPGRAVVVEGRWREA
jgi:hypothetical protein